MKTLTVPDLTSIPSTNYLFYRVLETISTFFSPVVLPFDQTDLSHLVISCLVQSAEVVCQDFVEFRLDLKLAAG